MYRIVLILILLLSSLSIRSQNKTISILSLDGDFMMPIIEEQLNLLHYKPSENTIGDSIITWTRYFAQVTNLNTQRQYNKVYGEIKSIYDLNNLLGRKVQDEYDINTIKYRNYISNTILDNEYLLIIKSSGYGSYLECQFRLYSISTNDGIPLLTDDYLLTQENFILNLANRPKSTIRNKIKTLFIDSNNPPVPKLNIDGVDISRDTIITVPVDTKIRIDGSSSYDRDGDDLSYVWRNLYTTKNPETFEPLIFEKGNSIQSIEGAEFKYSGIQFYVSDEVHNSDTLKVILQFTPSSLSHIFDKEIYYFEYDNYFKVKDNASAVINYSDDSKYLNDHSILLSMSPIGETRITSKWIEDHKSYLIPFEKVINGKGQLDSLIIHEKDIEERDKIYAYTHNLTNNYLTKIAEVPISRKYRSPFNFYSNISYQIILSNNDDITKEHLVTRFGLGAYLTKSLEVIIDYNYYNSIVGENQNSYYAYPKAGIGLKYNITQNVTNHNDENYSFAAGVNKHEYSNSEDQMFRTAFLRGSTETRLFNKKGWALNLFSSLGVTTNFDFYTSINIDVGLKYNIGGN